MSNAPQKPQKPRQSLVPLAIFGAFAAAALGWLWMYRHAPPPVPEEPPLVSSVSPPKPALSVAVDAGP